METQTSTTSTAQDWNDISIGTALRPSEYALSHPDVQSFSSIFVKTAEPIEYSYKYSNDSDNSEPSEADSESNTSVATAVSGEFTKEQNGDQTEVEKLKKHRFSDLNYVESVIYQTRLQKDPPSNYHVLELNTEPIDLVPRYLRIPSQYQLNEMYEFSALQSPDAIAKYNSRTGNAEVDAQYNES